MVNDHIAIAGMTSPCFIGNIWKYIDLKGPFSSNRELLDDPGVYLIVFKSSSYCHGQKSRFFGGWEKSHL